MKKKILGMGNAVLDIIFSCKEKDLVEMGLIKGQMSLVENDNSANIFKKFNSVKILIQCKQDQFYLIDVMKRKFYR